MSDDSDDSEEDIQSLQKSALESAQLANGKIQFMAQHGVINPFAVMQSRVENLIEWFLPSETVDGLPTNPERLRFDIYCNLRTIAKCDEAMGQTGSGLHVVKGHGVDG